MFHINHNINFLNLVFQYGNIFRIYVRNTDIQIVIRKISIFTSVGDPISAKYGHTFEQLCACVFIEHRCEENKQLPPNNLESWAIANLRPCPPTIACTRETTTTTSRSATSAARKVSAMAGAHPSAQLPLHSRSHDTIPAKLPIISFSIPASLQTRTMPARQSSAVPTAMGAPMAPPTATTSAATVS